MTAIWARSCSRRRIGAIVNDEPGLRVAFSAAKALERVSRTRVLKRSRASLTARRSPHLMRIKFPGAPDRRLGLINAPQIYPTRRPRSHRVECEP